MKAGQWSNKLQKVVTNDVPIPEPKEGQVLIKVASASLCHSDLIMNNRPNVEQDITMGHEGVGIIGEHADVYVHEYLLSTYPEKIHPSAEGKGFKVGDAVGCGYFIDCCFECNGCQTHK